MSNTSDASEWLVSICISQKGGRQRGHGRKHCDLAVGHNICDPQGSGIYFLLRTQVARAPVDNDGRLMQFGSGNGGVGGEHAGIGVMALNHVLACGCGITHKFQ